MDISLINFLIQNNNSKLTEIDLFIIFSLMNSIHYSNNSKNYKPCWIKTLGNAILHRFLQLILFNQLHFNLDGNNKSTKIVLQTMRITHPNNKLFYWMFPFLMETLYLMINLNLQQTNQKIILATFLMMLMITKITCFLMKIFFKWIITTLHK